MPIYTVTSVNIAVEFWDAILIPVQNLILITRINIVACLLKGRIVKPAEKEPLLGNGCVTLNNELTMGSRFPYVVRVDSYAFQQ
jgi:hypothetical protein